MDYDDPTIEELARKQGVNSVRDASPGYTGNQLRLDPSGTEAANRAYMAERLPPKPDMGEALRNQPPADMSELRNRLSTPAAAPPVAEATPVRPRTGPVVTNSTPYTAGPDGVSESPPADRTLREKINYTDPQAEAEQSALRERMRAGAVPPRNVPLGTTPGAGTNPGLYDRVTAAASESARGALPPGSGLVGKVAPIIGRGAMTIGGVAARSLAPAVEGYNVAKVALDPNASKLDVGTQVAEGVGRTASTIAGAGIGGAVGAMTGPAAPVMVPVGAVAGGAAGYFGGDATIRALRSAFGLDPASPASKAPSLMPAASAAAPPAKPGTAAPAAAPAAPAKQPSTKVQPTSKVGSTPSTIAAAAAPQYELGKNAVEVVQGGDRHVQLFGDNGGATAVPSDVFYKGPGAIAEYGRNVTEMQNRAMLDPSGQQAHQRVTNEGNLAVAKETGQAHVAAAGEAIRTPVRVTDQLGNTNSVFTGSPQGGGQFHTPPLPRPPEAKARADAKARLKEYGNSQEALDTINAQFKLWGYAPMAVGGK